MFGAGQSNEEIARAIEGPGFSEPATTMSTGVAGANMPAAPNPLDMNQNYVNTLQNLGMGGQQQGGMAQNLTAASTNRHNAGVGRDNWGSGMTLDHSAILNSLGLGEQ